MLQTRPWYLTRTTTLREMEELRQMVDQVNRNGRNTHLVLTGLGQEFQNIQGVVHFVRNQLKVNLQPCELASVSSIGLSKQGQTLTKVPFYSLDSRVKVYKARATMKGTANWIWLNEDLTKRRDWLDYIARLLLKGKHIDKNWTFLGDILIKTKQLLVSQRRSAQKKTLVSYLLIYYPQGPQWLRPQVNNKPEVHLQ